MIAETGIALTPAGFCVNPDCHAPLFLELMPFPDSEACIDCNPSEFDEASGVCS